MVRASKEVVTWFRRPGRQVGQFTALHNIAVDGRQHLHQRGQYRPAGAEVPAGRRAELAGLAREPERLGDPVADRLGGFVHDLLGQRREFLQLRRRELELLALMRQRHLEQFGQ